MLPDTAQSFQAEPKYILLTYSVPYMEEEEEVAVCAVCDCETVTVFN